MIALWVALLLTGGVYLCHRYNREWDYLFGILFFAGIPFGGLAEEGLTIALWGYSLSASILIGLTLFAYLMEYRATGNWQAGV